MEEGMGESSESRAEEMLRLRTALALIPGSTLVIFACSYDVIHPATWIDDHVQRRTNGRWILTAIDPEKALDGQYGWVLAVLPYGQPLKDVPPPLGAQWSEHTNVLSLRTRVGGGTC